MNNDNNTLTYRWYNKKMSFQILTCLFVICSILAPRCFAATTSSTSSTPLVSSFFTAPSASTSTTTYCPDPYAVCQTGTDNIPLASDYGVTINMGGKPSSLIASIISGFFSLEYGKYTGIVTCLDGHTPDYTKVGYVQSSDSRIMCCGECPQQLKPTDKCLYFNCDGSMTSLAPGEQMARPISCNPWKHGIGGTVATADGFVPHDPLVDDGLQCCGYCEPKTSCTSEAELCRGHLLPQQSEYNYFYFAKNRALGEIVGTPTTCPDGYKPDPAMLGYKLHPDDPRRMCCGDCTQNLPKACPLYNYDGSVVNVKPGDRAWRVDYTRTETKAGGGIGYVDGAAAPVNTSDGYIADPSNADLQCCGFCGDLNQNMKNFFTTKESCPAGDVYTILSVNDDFFLTPGGIGFGEGSCTNQGIIADGKTRHYMDSNLPIPIYVGTLNSGKIISQMAAAVCSKEIPGSSAYVVFEPDTVQSYTSCFTRFSISCDPGGTPGFDYNDAPGSCYTPSTYNPNPASSFLTKEVCSNVADGYKPQGFPVPINQNYKIVGATDANCSLLGITDDSTTRHYIDPTKPDIKVINTDTNAEIMNLTQGLIDACKANNPNSIPYLKFWDSAPTTSTCFVQFIKPG